VLTGEKKEDAIGGNHFEQKAGRKIGKEKTFLGNGEKGSKRKMKF